MQEASNSLHLLPLAVDVPFNVCVSVPAASQTLLTKVVFPADWTNVFGFLEEGDRFGLRGAGKAALVFIFIHTGSTESSSFISGTLN